MSPVFRPAGRSAWQQSAPAEWMSAGGDGGAGVPVWTRRATWAPADQRRRARMRQRYAVSAGLAVPGVVRPLGLGADADGLTLAFPLLPGADLETLLGAMAPQRLPMPELLHIAATLADVLQALGGCGVVHGALTARHVQYDAAGAAVWLLDFGDARFVHAPVPAHLDVALDHGDDLRALGHLLYRLATGRPMPQGGGAGARDVAGAWAPEPIPPLSERFITLLIRLLDAGRPGGYRSAAAFAQDLARLRTGDEPDTVLGEPPAWSLPHGRFGRHAEVAALVDAFADAAHPVAMPLSTPDAAPHHTVLMLVDGPAGVGKSAVVAAACRILARQGARIAHGKFNQFGDGTPVFALAQALGGALAAVLDGDAPRRDAMAAALRAALGPGAGALAELLPGLPALLGPLAAVPELSGDASRLRRELMVRRLVATLAARDAPLVMVLDDLQWADPASLELLHGLLREPTRGPLLVIGVYRSEAVGTDHPLHALAQRLGATALQVRRATVSAWSAQDVARMLEVAGLRGGTGRRHFVKLLLGLTGGNPMGVLQALRVAQLSGAVRFDTVRGAWRIDADRARRVLLGRSVIDLVTYQLAGLDAPSQEMVCTGAYLGARFDADALAVGTARTAHETVVAAGPALAAGLLEVAAETPALRQALPLRLAHDLVQQAAHELEDSSGTRLHLRIGRALLAECDAADALRTRLFEVVHQFNQVPPQELGGDERGRMLELNASAGRHAFATGAVAAALEHFQRARQLQAADAWQRRADLSAALGWDTANAAYVAGDFEVMDGVIGEMSHQRLDALWRARVQTLRVLGLVARTRFAEAMAEGEAALAELGVALLPMRPPDTWPVVSAPTPTALDLPCPPRVDAALQLLLTLAPATVMMSTETQVRVNLTMVGLAQRHPSSVLAPLCFTGYAIMLCGVGREPEAFETCELAFSLAARHDDAQMRCKVHVAGWGFLQHWRRPVTASHRPLAEAFDACLAYGDREYLGYAGGLIVHNSWPVRRLDALEAEHAVRTRLVGQVGHDIAWRYARVWLQFIRAVRGGSADSLAGAHEAFEGAEDGSAPTDRHNRVVPFNIHVALAWLAWHRGDVEAVLRHCEVAAANELVGAYMTVQRAQVHALALLRSLDGCDEPERAARLETAAALRAQFGRWVAMAPANFEHKAALVEAEWQRAAGDAPLAWPAYERAMELADRSAFLHDRGVAAEAAGECLVAQGRRGSAARVLQRAWRAYMAWGGTAVAEGLLRRHPWLGEGPRSSGVTVRAGLPEKLGAWLDEVHASRVIVWDDSLDLAVIADAQDGSPRVTTHAVTRAEPGVLPAGMRRTMAEGTLMVDDPASDPAWADDPYFAARRPPWMAVIPLVREGQVCGLAAIEAPGARLIASRQARDHVAWQARGVIDELRLEVLQRRLLASTQTDSQTGLPNRPAFTRQVDLAVARAHLARGRTLAVMLVRLRPSEPAPADGPSPRAGKALDELVRRLGRAAGDLPTLGHVDRLTLGVLLARGGAGDAHEIARRLQPELKGERPDDLAPPCDIGIAVSHPLSDGESLLSDAEAALNALPARGPGGTMVFDARRHRRADERDALARDLMRAIEHEGLRLVYQPVVSMRDNRLLGAEALLRWRHPVRGDVPTPRLIDVAEGSGLIGRLGHWVSRTLMAQAGRWTDHGRLRLPDLSFNVSALELVQPDYAERLLALMDDHRVPPGSVAVEITESSSIQDEPGLRANLRTLQAAGITLCIDDFGVGTSSLGRLHTVLARRLKIDRSFIEGLDEDAGLRTTVRMIIQLAEALHMDVVAEGVSSAGEAEFLIGEGLVKAQGFRYAPPLELDEIERAIARGCVMPRDGATA